MSRQEICIAVNRLPRFRSRRWGANIPLQKVFLSDQAAAARLNPDAKPLRPRIRHSSLTIRSTATQFSEPALRCVSTRCGHGHEPQPVPPANIRDAARGTTGVVKDAAGRIENQKAQALGPCG